MSELTTNDAQNTANESRQHANDSAETKSREWADLLALRPSEQPFVASVLLLLALVFGGWYVWRATTSPGLIDIDTSEPVSSKLVVNVNTAEAAELMLLPEIGPVLAEAILEERKAKGLFRNANEFGTRIKGIGKVKLAKLAPHLEGWIDEVKQ